MLEQSKNNWLYYSVMVVTVTFSLIYLKVLLNLNECVLLATIKWVPMLICKSVVLVNNYKSKKSTDYSFAYLGLNLIPFGVALLSVPFTGINYTWMQEVMAYTFFLIPQIGSFAILSFTAKSK
jgi:hypothetical protein